jgi:hypothetical protein
MSNLSEARTPHIEVLLSHPALKVDPLGISKTRAVARGHSGKDRLSFGTRNLVHADVSKGFSSSYLVPLLNEEILARVTNSCTLSGRTTLIDEDEST